jgi:aspartyl-tRNA(Asn)/glutamyl-tRNA(Gln) amidotransferase subunit A
MKSLVKEHIEKIKSGKISLDEFIADIKKKIEKIQAEYSPFITIKIEKPEKKGKLYGVPISVKDNICTKDLQSTAGSKILEGYIPPFDATCVKKTKEEGGIIIGKTAQDEFGFGSFSVNSFVVPKNPFDKSRVCGGSSGGAACLTQLADFPHIAIAESTGGSISCPASFCGVVGITPTYGRVSRWGLIDYANSLDKIGTMGKTVYDAALLLSVISGHDPLDSTSLEVRGENFTKYCKENFKINIAVPKEYFSEGVNEKIKDLVWKAIKKLEGEGAKYQEVSLPHTTYALPSYYLIAMAEASTNLAKFCGMRYGFHSELKGNYDEYFSQVRAEAFGEEAKRRIILGTYARMAGFRDAYYLKALQVRTKVIEDFKKVFKSFDVIIAPTMPVLPPRFDEIEKLEPIEVYMMDILTVAPNLAGIPMVSLPCGFVNGLPVGLHIMADHLQEKKIIQVAYTFEQVEK